MNSIKIFKTILFSILLATTLNSCNGKLPGGDAREFPDDPKLRVEQELGRRAVDLGCHDTLDKIGEWWSIRVC
jgi:hypothetical protein